MPVPHARATAVTSTDEQASGNVPGLLEVFCAVPDPRRFRGRRYRLAFVQRHDDPRGEPNWQPVTAVTMMAGMLTEQLAANREQLELLELLERARREPWLLDDATVDRVKKVFGVSVMTSGCGRRMTAAGRPSIWTPPPVREPVCEARPGAPGQLTAQGPGPGRLAGDLGERHQPARVLAAGRDLSRFTGVCLPVQRAGDLQEARAGRAGRIRMFRVLLAPGRTAGLSGTEKRGHVVRVSHVPGSFQRGRASPAP